MRYPAIITKEGKHTLAEFPDCPGCQTFAEPGEDIERMAKEALEGWLESHLAHGEVAPLPKVRRGAFLGVAIDPMLAVKVSIRWHRAQKDWSQGELAKRMGVSQPMVAKIENPDVKITFETIGKAAQALGLEFNPVLQVQGQVKVRGVRVLMDVEAEA